MDINNFPDKLFTKKQLLEKFFPAIHKSTLERYMRDINENDVLSIKMSNDSVMFKVSDIKKVK